MAIKYSKESISIQNIGKQRFWIGIITGLVTAIILLLSFNYFRELLRFLSLLSDELIFLDEFEAQFYNYFFAFSATVLGLLITISVWMTNKSHARKKDRMYKQLAITNNLLFFSLFIWLITRLSSVFTFVLFATPGYQNHLNLFENFWHLFILIPIVIFAQSWCIIRRIYLSGKWILISFVTCLLIAIILKQTISINHEILNTNKFNPIIIPNYR